LGLNDLDEESLKKIATIQPNAFGGANRAALSSSEWVGAGFAAVDGRELQRGVEELARVLEECDRAFSHLTVYGVMSLICGCAWA
jgi:hypothetical protein